MFGKFFKKDDDSEKKDQKPSSSTEVGKFGGLIKASSSTGNPSLEDRLKQTSNQSTSRYLGGVQDAHLALLLDTTGSMHSLIELAKGAMTKIVDALHKEGIGTNVHIQIYEYKDYSDQPVFSKSEVSNSAEKLTAWIGKLSATGGNMRGSSEAIEAPLGHILYNEKFDFLIIAGDAPSHSQDEIRAYRQQSPTARDLASSFGQKNVPIYTFMVGESLSTENDFREISKRSNGAFGKIATDNDDFVQMVVMPILKKVKGGSTLQKYMSNHLLTANAQSFGQLLLGDGKNK